MPPTKQQRDSHEEMGLLCGAKRSNGQRCRMYKGQGTDHPGIGRCFRHGGASPQHRKAAAAVKIEQRLHAEAEALTDDEAQPHHVLKELLKKTGGRLRWLDAELARDHSATADRLFKEERQFLAWISKMCSEVGVEQIEAHIKQAQATLMAEMVQEALRLAGLSDEQIQAAGSGLRLLALRAAGEEAAAEAEAVRLDEARERWEAADRERIERLAREEAQRLSGLTLPPAEWVEVEEPTSPDGSASP